MTAKYRRKYTIRSNRWQAVKYLFFSIIFVFVMLKWGVPLMIQVLSWMTGNKSLESVDEVSIKPQKPVLQPLSEATYSAQINIDGVVQADMVVKLSDGQGAREETISDSSGDFVFKDISLQDGENTFTIIAVKDDRESDPATVAIVYDNQKPTVTVTEPANEQTFHGPSERVTTIRGTISEPESKVEVGGNFVTLDSGGGFASRFSLNEGVNEIVISAVDRAGNQTEKLLRLSYYP